MLYAFTRVVVALYGKCGRQLAALYPTFSMKNGNENVRCG
jgi:hypothetical protein